MIRNSDLSLEDDEIVISGFSGRFPESNNMNELRDNLMNKNDMITSDARRWDFDHPQVPKMLGKISNLEKFDATFFGIHSKQADVMDPQSRLLLEHTYEAIIDAGVNPKNLRGTKTGVFIGATYSESEKTWLYEEQDSGFGLAGVSRAMFCNRISHWLDLTGPSFTIDAACSSSLTAVEQAYRSIKDGYCEAAIVGGSTICLQPYMSMQSFKLGSLTSNGRCRTWDESADGYVRSESVCVAFLQKSKQAKRIYATIIHSMINCDGYKEKGISFPSRIRQSALFRQLYDECGISTRNIGYFEAHGTGTKIGDAEEIAAIDEVLGKGRSKDDPLLIGSVKTNLGHTEPVSGLVSIAKVLLAMETGIIPPNLHFEKCKEELKAILDGRLKVVTELTPWQGEYAAVNSFGIGGANAHVLLRINSKEKINNGAPNDNLPRLVVLSGRTEDAVDTMLRDLESKSVDVEQLALLNSVHSDEINGHLYRGYTILPSHGTINSHMREIGSISGPRLRPVCFVFSGMGSQWPTMGKTLLRVKLFAEAIKKCDLILRGYGVDLFKVITSDDKMIFDNPLNCFVGITSIQIGLIDILKSLKIKPDYIIGHSAGELACAYADDCFTAEQTILAAYYRGMACKQSVLISGSMAAVGLGYKEVKKLCPDDIEVACHNSSSSSTVSGPVDSIKKFVEELKSKSIFVREVNSSGIPFHSSYIKSVGPKLLTSLKTIIPNPKLRSRKWLSTSIEMDKWNDDLAIYSSADYYTNNFLSPVLFEETLIHVPKDSIVIEIAPHGILQAILKRSLPMSVTNISLTQRGSDDNVMVLLTAIGKMYNVGLYPRIDKLYPVVKFPVSRGTPMISPMIKWEHKDNWFVSYFKNEQSLGSGERIVKIDIGKSDYVMMSDHLLNGHNVLPVSSYLILIWETFAKMKGKQYNDLTVIFENIEFLKDTKLPAKGDVKLTLMIQKGTGRFEVVDGDDLVCNGNIRSIEHSGVQINRKSNSIDEDDYMTSRDIYKEFKLRGYQYRGKFRNISRVSISGTKARIIWRDNWTLFMDSLLQLVFLGYDTRELLVAKSINRIIIDPNYHHTQVKSVESEIEFEASYDKFDNVVSSGGIEISGVKIQPIARKSVEKDNPLIEEYKFVSYIDDIDSSLEEIGRLATQIVIENHTGIKIKTVELLEETDVPISPWIAKCLEDTPIIQSDVNIIGKTIVLEDELPANISRINLDEIQGETSASLVIGNQLLTEDQTDRLNLLLSGLKPDGFLLTREMNFTNIDDVVDTKGFHLVSIKKSGDKSFVLLKRKSSIPKKIVVINVNNHQLNWVDEMREKMSAELEMRKADDIRIYFVGQDGFDNGLLGFFNCIRREPGGEVVRAILIQDPKALSFSPLHPFYSQQLNKDLALSVLRENGIWGGYRHLPLLPRYPQAKPVYHYYLHRDGNNKSLTWLEGPLRIDDHRDLIEIDYASIDPSEPFVWGYSGIDRSGKRIMGISINNHEELSNLCIPDSTLTWIIPKDWNLEDAATVPRAYVTCFRALYSKGQLKRDEKILIHAGIGSIALAAINLALTEGCQVFVIASTKEQHQFLIKAFSQIIVVEPCDFGLRRWIKERTNGLGVDIIVSVSGLKSHPNLLDCLASDGRFIEIGMLNKLSMINEIQSRDITFHYIALDRCLSNIEKIEIHGIFDEYLKKSAIKPLSRTVFTKDRVNDVSAYKKHAAGEILIKIRNDEVLTAMPRYHCRDDRSYLVHGGLGGLGLELGNWLIDRGAKNLVLTSRTGIKTAYQKWRTDLWKKRGVKLIIIHGKDASIEEDCRFIIKITEKLAPIDGIFNLAVVLQASLWYNHTKDHFEKSLVPKAWTTKNFDCLSRELCSKLRHFVVFSSVSCGRGIAGLTDYGMTNSVMERICERRVSEGLPGLAIQWGPIGDVGIMLDIYEDDKNEEINGTRLQSVKSFFQELDGFLCQSRSIVSSLILAEKDNCAIGSSNVLNAVLNVMCFKDLTGISLHSLLSELGLDSMMAVDIKHSFEREFNVFLGLEDIRNLTFAKLQEMANVE